MDQINAELGEEEGPYFLASFSLVDCVFSPFLERIAASIPYYKVWLLVDDHNCLVFMHCKLFIIISDKIIWLYNYTWEQAFDPADPIPPIQFKGGQFGRGIISFVIWIESDAGGDSEGGRQVAKS